MRVPDTPVCETTGAWNLECLLRRCHVTPRLARASLPSTRHAGLPLPPPLSCILALLLMAVTMPDSDSDFGYDFSVEEEELLAQLTSANPTAPRQQSPPQDAKLAVIDSVPGRSDKFVTRHGTAEPQDLPALDLESPQPRYEQAPATFAPASSEIQPGKAVWYSDRM